VNTISEANIDIQFNEEDEEGSVGAASETQHEKTL
jgi:hypothetical protein